MSKLLRVLLVLGLVVIVTWLASNSVAWAGFTSKGNTSISSNAADPALASSRANAGTVKPPPPALIIHGGSVGSFSAGGFCLIKVEYLSPEFLIEVERSYYSGFGQPLPVPDGIFLSAVCHLQYHTIFGAHVSNIPPDQGSVQICFAAIPDRTGDIFVYSPPTWTDLPTSVDNLLACAPANQSGYYVRRGR
jgi:hypothetical protein